MAEENRTSCAPGGCPYNELLTEFISTQKADIETFCQEALDAGFDRDALGMDGDSEAAGLQVKEGEGLSLEVSRSGEPQIDGCAGDARGLDPPDGGGLAAPDHAPPGQHHHQRSEGEGPGPGAAE